MTKRPRGAEIGLVIDVVLFVESDDRLFVILYLVGERHDRVRGKLHPRRGQHHMLAHVLGGGVVLLEQIGRHHQRFARVAEALAGRRIDRERLGGPDVDARQIADRVVVFGVGESARQHHARIARQLLRLGRQHPLDRVERRARSSPLGCLAFSGGMSPAFTNVTTCSHCRNSSPSMVADS